MRDLTKIIDRKLADDLTVAVYAAIRFFTRDKMYGLTNQLRRAAYSVPANIAEGTSRSTQKDYLRLHYILLGLNSKTRHFFYLSHRLGYLSDENFQPTYYQVQEVGRTLTGLIKSVEKETGMIRSATPASAFFSSPYSVPHS